MELEIWIKKVSKAQVLQHQMRRQTIQQNKRLQKFVKEDAHFGNYENILMYIVHIKETM